LQNLLFYQLLSVDAQIKVAEETLINRDQSVETIRALKSRICTVGVKQTEAQKYATEIIIADLKNTTIILEYHESAEPSAKIERVPLNLRRCNQKSL
jgi:hypothetical protein